MRTLGLVANLTGQGLTHTNQIKGLDLQSWETPIEIYSVLGYLCSNIQLTSLNFRPRAIRETTVISSVDQPRSMAS